MGHPGDYKWGTMTYRFISSSLVPEFSKARNNFKTFASDNSEFSFPYRFFRLRTLPLIVSFLKYFTATINFIKLKSVTANPKGHPERWMFEKEFQKKKKKTGDILQQIFRCSFSPFIHSESDKWSNYPSQTKPWHPRPLFHSIWSSLHILSNEPMGVNFPDSPKPESS